jgi:predicted dienelactone hydrolase
MPDQLWSRRAALTAAAASIAQPALAARSPKPSPRLAGKREQDIFARYRERGPFPVSVANPLSFTVPDQGKDLLVRVTYPDPSAPSDGRSFPVILFSHGALSSKDLYARVADHWASHGFVTVQPTHLDSESLGFKLGGIDQMKLVMSRIGDMLFLLDNLDAVAAQSPALSGRLAKDRIAAAGHSFGGMVALALAGVPIKQPNGQLREFGDARIKALVAYNGVGPLPYLAEDWSRVTMPVFAASGTNDPGATGDGILRPWRWRIGAYDRTAGKERFAVSVAGGDHYYGGLICREGAGGKPDPEGLAIVNAMSTAFLDGYLGGNAAARSLLTRGDLPMLTGQRAFLETTA